MCLRLAPLGCAEGPAAGGAWLAHRSPRPEPAHPPQCLERGAALDEHAVLRCARQGAHHSGRRGQHQGTGAGGDQDLEGKVGPALQGPGRQGGQGSGREGVEDMLGAQVARQGRRQLPRYWVWLPVLSPPTQLATAAPLTRQSAAPSSSSQGRPAMARQSSRMSGVYTRANCEGEARGGQMSGVCVLAGRCLLLASLQRGMRSRAITTFSAAHLRHQRFGGALLAGGSLHQRRHARHGRVCGSRRGAHAQHGRPHVERASMDRAAGAAQHGCGLACARGRRRAVRRRRLHM